MNVLHELISEWIRKADHDLGMAELALQYKPGYTDAICFHSQQAVEKYLKAYLTVLQIKFEKSHNLVYLLDLIHEQEVVADELYDLLERLEDYAVEVRYPDERFEPTLEEAKEAFEIANKLKAYVLDKIADSNP